MRTRAIVQVSTILFIGLCYSKLAICYAIQPPQEPNSLRSFLQTGYASARSILDDVRMEYQEAQILLVDHAIFKQIYEFELKETPPHVAVAEYVQKHGKERWALLYVGSAAPTEDVSPRAGLIGTRDSSRFKVFDGQCILDYLPTKADGYTSVGRATLDADATGFLQSVKWPKYAPIQFFGYDTRLMPDDVLSSPRLRIETTPEKAGTLLTYKISAPFEFDKSTFEITYWLSPERSCLPVKTEVVRNGSLIRRIEAKEFLELGDGRWAIKSIAQRNFVTKRGEGPLIELSNLTYIVRKLELRPEIDEEKVFSTSPDRLPAGVDVIDRISGLRYFTSEETRR